MKLQALGAVRTPCCVRLLQAVGCSSLLHANVARHVCYLQHFMALMGLRQLIRQPCCCPECPDVIGFGGGIRNFTKPKQIKKSGQQQSWRSAAARLSVLQQINPHFTA